jgi:RND family efflux transporter MFP subunit
MNREDTKISSTEQRLRAEVADLKRQLEEQRKLAREAAKLDAVPPSKGRLWSIVCIVLLCTAAAFVAGYLPRHRRETMLVAEAKAISVTAPLVNVVTVDRSDATSELVLPGNIQAVTEAPVLARASGYIRRRYVDIGDRVKKDQLLAEIEAPEVDQQVQQAKAALAQSESVLEQANANLQQARANEQLAKVTADRWDKLAKRGAVSRQENDTYQAQYLAQQANVQALEKAVAAAKSNIAASQANLNRLSQLQGFENVTAPFAGVITLRNIDTGTLISEGNTLLFRMAQTDRLRTFVNVPQADAESVRVGQTARLTISERPGRQFTGMVTRTANALDPATRTLLTEVQVPNPNGALLPGMYAQVDLKSPRRDPPLLIPGDTLLVRPEGTEVALVNAEQKVHFQRIQLGRDYGAKIEVLGGLEAGQKIIVNPGDAVREGVKVNPVLLREKKRP